MKLILRNNKDPYFNIAAEEYFLKKNTEDIIMFWQNKPSVVIGKHQNTIAETNLDFINTHNIPVIRRISGGGTVYHDEGNINYTIISSSENTGRLVDFVQFTNPLIEFLKTMGLEALFQGKNNLTINGQKFSGNSAHVFKNRILNHGTILFNTNLNYLESAISSAGYNIIDKGVKSIRANVVNLIDLLAEKKSINEFKSRLVEFFVDYFKITSIEFISEKDLVEINKLVKSKYGLWEWNYGYSPTFTFNNNTDGGSISIEIKKGIIIAISIACNNQYDDILGKSIIGKRFEHSIILGELTKLKLNSSTTNTYVKLFGIIPQ